MKRITSLYFIIFVHNFLMNNFIILCKRVSLMYYLYHRSYLVSMGWNVKTKTKNDNLIRFCLVNYGNPVKIL